MQRIFAPLAAFVTLGLGVGTVSAASPTYCALFAKEFVKHATADGKQSQPSTLIHDRAYHKCLNLDEEPRLPTAYADPATDGNSAPLAVEQSSRARNEPAAKVSTPPERPAANPPPAAATAALQPGANPAAQEPAKRKLRSWMDGFLGKFRRAPPPSPETSVLGERALTMTASERAAHCAKYYPKSYDPRTGTVIPYKTGVRTRC